MDAELDALIITGAQPAGGSVERRAVLGRVDRTHRLGQGTHLLDDFRAPAAHAGVLHLDGVERHRLSEKCAGVFAFQVQRNHPLSGEQGRVRLAPHSRHSGLLQSDLERAGYDVLTSSPDYGVDCFIKSFGSRFVFFRVIGYDANSLAKNPAAIWPYTIGETLTRAPEARRLFHRRSRSGISYAGAPVPRRFPWPADRRVVKNRRAVSLTDALWRDAAIAFYRSWIETVAISTCRRSESALEVSPQFFGRLGAQRRQSQPCMARPYSNQGGCDRI